MAKAKLYYKIGEACKILDIQPYVLRYWETEFPILSPSKSKSGQRVYGEVDFELIRRIKELLYEEGFTIAGAKKRLEGELAEGGPKSRDTAGAERRKAVKARADEQSVAKGDSAETERLREGVGKALAQARGILEYLDR